LNHSDPKLTGEETARHDRVVWVYAEGAMQRRVHISQRTAVTGLVRDGDRVMAVETEAGPISAGLVLGAADGESSVGSARRASAPRASPADRQPLFSLEINFHARESLRCLVLASGGHCRAMTHPVAFREDLYPSD
jgi:hypothetical protein